MAGSDDGRWVQIWRGNDPGPVGRMLDDAGIPMRIATGSHQGSNLGLLGIFRKPALARLLVPESERDRAKEIVAAARAKL